MPQSNEVEFGVLNIAANPHPDHIYQNLLKSVSKRVIQFWGTEHAAITEPEMTEPGYYVGLVIVWIELDRDAAAFDKTLFEEVRVADTDIFVPDNLGLNSHHFFYVLRERDHRIFFESRSDEGHHLAPTRFKKILDRLFAPTNLRGEIEVTVTVQPDEDGLDKVLAIPRMTKLEIVVTVPNPDQNQVLYKKIMKRLTDQNAVSEETVYRAKSRKQGLQPSEDTIDTATVAADNGVVAAEGFDKTGKIKLPRRSTEEYPKIIPYIIEGAGSALAGLIATAKRTVFRERKRPDRDA